MASNLQKTLQKMYESSYTSICQNENLTNNPLSHYQLYIENKNKYLFKTNFNSNANFIKIKQKGRYLKFSLSINLITKEDKKEIKKHTFNKGIMSIYERGALNRTSLEVYADGIKMPDDEVFITLYDGSLDLYVPEKYINDNIFLDIITKKYAGNDKFSNIIVRDISARVIDFNLNNKEEINKEDILIFKNGLLLTENLDYEIINLGLINRFKVIFGSNINKKDVLEIVLDPFNIYYSCSIEKENDLILIPNNILPNLPISLDICKCFNNGKRIFNRDFDILSPRTFKIKDFVNKSKVLFFINYKGLYIETNDAYNEDGIKVFNSLTKTEIEDIFIKDKAPNAYLDWIKDLEYPPKPINIIPNPNLLRNRTYEEFIDDTVKEFLQDNAHNIVPLLNEYKDTSRCKYTFNVLELEKRSSTTMELGTVDVQVFHNKNYLITIPKKYEKFHIICMVDNIKINDDYLTIKVFKNSIYVYIDENYLDGKNQIILDVIPVFNSINNNIKFTITQSQNQIIKVKKSSLGIIQNINDIIIMKKNNNGFDLQKLNQDYILEEKMDDIVISFIDKKLLDQFFIYNSSFFDREIIEIEEDMSIYKLDRELPYYSNYTIELYNNGKLMMENIDYFLSNQKNIDDLDEELIIFRNLPKKGDKLEIYHLEISRLPFSSCQVVENDKYDLVYFDTDRNFGYGKEYIDLYINDIYVKPENIVELSLNLIAVNQNNIPRPYKYINAVSKFNSDITNIDKYINFHKENPSKFAIYIDNLISVNAKKEIDDIASNILPSLKEKEDNDLLLEDKNLINPLLDEIAKRLRIGTLDRRIDANKSQPVLDHIDLRKLMDYKQLNSAEIEFNSNINELTEGLEISADDTLIPLDELTYIVAKEVQDNNFPYGMNYEDMTDEEYEKHNISNKLYLEEIKFANLNINIPETIIIDANTIEEEYSLQEVTKEINIRLIKKILNPDSDGNEFFYRLSVKNLLIEELTSIIIDKNNAINDVIFNPELKVIDIFTDIQSSVTIKYMQRIYSE